MALIELPYQRRVDALITKYPQDPHLRFQKGLLLVDQKRIAEAIALFERMGREYPTLPEPLNNLAVLYAEQGQIEKARAALESAVRSRPSYDTAYQNLSSVNVRMASRAYARALQIDDSSGAPKLALLKSLTGSQQDGPVTVAAASPTTLPSPSPASASPPAASAPPPATPAKPPPLAPADPAPKPDATETSHATASANPATSNAAQRRTTDEAREVNAAVRAWAAAWERKDMNSYFAAYEPGFHGNEFNASSWQAARRMRILGKSKISLELTGLTVEMLPNDIAKATFRQDYAADRLRASSPKVMELVKRNGRWLVRKESVGS